MAPALAVLSPYGRRGRRSFALIALLAGVALFAVLQLADAQRVTLVPPDSAIAALGLALVAALALIQAAVTAQRLRDGGASPWLALAMVVPVAALVCFAYALWLPEGGRRPASES